MKEAGEMAQNIQKGDLQIERKKDLTIVTAADYAVQEHLIEKLSLRFRNMNFIHEENFDRGFVNVDEETISAVIDPIDGTAMYSMHLPFWCVSLGIFKGYEPIYGFVFSPGSDLYFFNDNFNAYCNMNIVTIDDNIVIDRETNLFYASEAEKQFNVTFPGKVRNLGSTALHACLITDNRRNRALAFIGQSYLWDWAGAMPIILKAGGNIKYIDDTDIDFKKVINNNYQFEKNMLAYTGNDFNKIRSFFKEKSK
jgi:myo-inositol-1(or 4)-monophosphatase